MKRGLVFVLFALGMGGLFWLTLGHDLQYAESLDSWELYAMQPSSEVFRLLVTSLVGVCGAACLSLLDALGVKRFCVFILLAFAIGGIFWFAWGRDLKYLVYLNDSFEKARRLSTVSRFLIALLVGVGGSVLLLWLGGGALEKKRGDQARDRFASGAASVWTLVLVSCLGMTVASLLAWVQLRFGQSPPFSGWIAAAAFLYISIELFFRARGKSVLNPRLSVFLAVLMTAVLLSGLPTDLCIYRHRAPCRICSDLRLIDDDSIDGK